MTYGKRISWGIGVYIRPKIDLHLRKAMQHSFVLRFQRRILFYGTRLRSVNIRFRSDSVVLSLCRMTNSTSNWLLMVAQRTTRGLSSGSTRTQMMWVTYFQYSRGEQVCDTRSSWIANVMKVTSISWISANKSPLLPFAADRRRSSCAAFGFRGS